MADVVEIHETQDDFEVDEEGDRKLHYIPFTKGYENLYVCNILLYDQKQLCKLATFVEKMPGKSNIAQEVMRR